MTTFSTQNCDLINDEISLTSFFRQMSCNRVQPSFYIKHESI